MRHIFCGLLLLLASAPLYAQTTNVLLWDYDTTPAEVATYAQAVTIDGTAASGTPTCAVSGTNPQRTTCQLTIPALATGSHVINIAATRGGMTAETRITGVNPANGPRNALSPRVQVTVVVTVP